MSDFVSRLETISEAYAAKKAAERSFFAAWTKVSSEVIFPVLKAAKEHFHPENKSLTINRNGDISLEIRSIPVGKTKKLIYSPRASSLAVIVTSVIGSARESEEEVPLDYFSTDLIESQVEAFLKEALRIKVSDGE